MALRSTFLGHQGAKKGYHASETHLVRSCWPRRVNREPKNSVLACLEAEQSLPVPAEPLAGFQEPKNRVPSVKKFVTLDFVLRTP